MDEIFHVVRDGNALRLVGELDMSTVEELDAALRGAPDGEEITLDLTALTFIDSSGIQVLLRYVASRNGRAGDGTLVLVGAVPNVRRALEIVGIDRIAGVRLIDR